MGEQYDHLPKRTIIAVGVSVVVAAIIMIPLISHLVTVAIVTICILSAVTISAGLSHFLGLKLNYALYVALVVAVGLSVEFCVHIARYAPLPQLQIASLLPLRLPSHRFCSKCHSTNIAWIICCTIVPCPQTLLVCNAW